MKHGSRARMLARTGAVVLLAPAFALAIGSGAMAEPAPPSEQIGNPEVTLRVEESPDAAEAITCQIFANKPNYSGGKITGTGGLSSCAGGTPLACNSEVDLQIYLSGPGWTTAGASPRQHRCPPPARSTTASVSCESTSQTYSYRSQTLGTITAGSTDSDTATSSTLNVKCL
ncbi:hypothetical protein JIX56_21585 [Streptomyces sp. CA-210063]|uniref:hypothetical protein n=1 Tax=Streptomyces sp. CA-210063 TaxID=2801029 RepID=UPI00214C6270|nr:hypothetical protein [Streptomyces sp. CA-210063]UUU32290.1 hypothetical protein JIX56_21585 [Streptomyces sp. CA-210063]